MPSALLIVGRYALINICITVTNVAIIVIYAGIRTLSGMTLRSAEITAFEQTSTTSAATPMPSPFNAAVVTASVGQVPSTSRNTGFSTSMPLVNSFVKLFSMVIKNPFGGL